MQCVGELGYHNTSITIKNDQEPALKALINRVVHQRTAQTLLQESPVGSSQSNGSIENAVDTVEAQIRKGRLALEHNYMYKIFVSHAITPWLVKHSGFAYPDF